ncbi:MAG: B12-binding domain-containing radical SAM protein, partial [Sulfuricellaceae bacterium]|nr:B12-binding domain-containing radical SAM protein [Sulfuricellaceae bacterium]
MNVLLIVPRYSTKGGEFYQFPLGLGYIASAMRQAGHTVTGLNLNHYHGEVESLVAEKVIEIDPDVCATGGLSPYLPVLKVIFAAARRAKPSILNIAGGGVVSGDPEACFELIDIDVGVIGEAELTIVELLECLGRSDNLSAINGIVFRENHGAVVRTPPRTPIKNLAEIAWPDYEVLGFEHHLAAQRVLDHHFFHTHPNSKPRAIDMVTSRSCPYSCTFCFHPVGKVYRERPLDDFFHELDALIARYDINMVAIIDELFSLRKSRLLEFCERIKPYNIQWMVQLHVICADENILTAMREAGCSYISYGIESMSQPVLDSMKKKTTRKRIEAALCSTYEHKIGIQGNLIFGDTAETLETANETMHWWANNRRYQVYLSRLQVFPGSPDYIKAVADGLITDRKYFLDTLPTYLNISGINEKNLEMLGLQIWVHGNTLFNLAPLHSFELSGDQTPSRGPAYDIHWQCPRCKNNNAYLGSILRPDHGQTLRLFCRTCLSRWDI